MPAELIYPKTEYDPWSRSERCRAETRPRRGDPARCGNRAPAIGPNEGLCWRHR